MEGTTIANIVVLAVIAFGAISGGIKGFTRQIIELCGLVVSFLAAAVLASWLASFLSEHSATPRAPALVISFTVVFIVGLVAFHFVAIGAQHLVRHSLLGWLDRAGGAALGFVTATLLVSILATMAFDLPLPRNVRASLDGSAAVNVVQPIAGWLFELAIPHGADGHIA